MKRENMTLGEVYAFSSGSYDQQHFIGAPAILIHKDARSGRYDGTVSLVEKGASHVLVIAPQRYCSERSSVEIDKARRAAAKILSGKFDLARYVHLRRGFTSPSEKDERKQMLIGLQLPAGWMIQAVVPGALPALWSEFERKTIMYKAAQELEEQSKTVERLKREKRAEDIHRRLAEAGIKASVQTYEDSVKLGFDGIEAVLERLGH